MSKIGKKIIKYDNLKVNVTLEDGGDFSYKKIIIKGEKGELVLSIRRGIEIVIDKDEIKVVAKDNSRAVKAYHGLYRSLISNMIEGVSKGYEKKLEIQGVGYRGTQQGEGIELKLGYSHSVKYTPREGIKLNMPDETTIVISGTSKQMVGQTAAEIRSIRKVEPYKGKGIRYENEQVKRKAGKSSITTQ